MEGALSRRDLLHRAAVGGALLAAGSLPAAARGRVARERDAQALRPALSLARLQAALYAEAAGAGAIRAELLGFARAAAAHERAHVVALQALAGAAAGAPPRWDLGPAARDDAAFTRTAILLGDLSVRALNGQVAHLSAEALAATAPIASADARHAAWIRALAGESPAHHVLDTGASAAAVAAALDRVRRAAGPVP